jgi:hypothetical protein
VLLQLTTLLVTMSLNEIFDSLWLVPTDETKAENPFQISAIAREYCSEPIPFCNDGVTIAIYSIKPGTIIRGHRAIVAFCDVAKSSVLAQ